MSSLKNDIFIRALLRQPVDYTPVWMMRQAGRYLPEYRATRKEAGNFMKLCQTPELACEVTLQPLRRYPFDAAILLSDILTIPDALGQGLYFEEGEGPKFRKVIREPADVEALPDIDVAGELSYVTDAVALIRRELNGSVPLIGFSGSPWTLATYMIEGGSSKDFRIAKQFLYDHPEAMHRLLEILADAVIQYLNAQIAAGAQAVQIFDTWGGILTTPAYREFSLAYMSRIVSRLTKLRDGQRIGTARQRIGSEVTLQGNMDPSILYASPTRIREEVARILADFGSGSGHVFNLGHGITPGVNPDNVAAFVESVHELSERYHS